MGMQRKINLIVMVLLLAGVLATAAADFRTSMQVESIVKELKGQDNGSLERTSDDLLYTWQKQIKDRYITAGFMGLVFVVILVLVLLVGPSKKPPRHISKEEAERFITEIEGEYEKNQLYVEESEKGEDDSLMEELLLTSLEMPKLREIKLNDDGVFISWDSVKHAQGYSIWRKTDGKKWEKIGKEKDGGTSYVDYNIASQTLYLYTVKAYAFVGKKRIASIKDPLGKHVYVEKGNIPDRPSVSAGTDRDGNPCVIWEDVENAQVYRVFRREPGGEWAKIDKISAGRDCCYYDETAQKGRLYEYTISACRFIHKKLVSGDYDAKGVQIQY